MLASLTVSALAADEVDNIVDISEVMGNGADGDEADGDLGFIEKLASRSKGIFSSLAAKSATVYSAITLLVSLAICFAGYKMMRIFLGIGGFCVGAFIAGRLVALIGLTDGKIAQIISVIAAVIVGALFATLTYKFMRAGIYLVGSFAAYLVLLEIPLPFVAVLILSIVGGVLSWFFVRVAITVVSAVAGGMTAGSSLVGFLPFISGLPYIHILLGVILVIAGMSTQLSLSKRRRS